MRGVTVAVLGAAVVAGVGVVALVQSELDSARRATRAVETPTRPKIEMTEILVAKTGMVRGQKLKSDNLAWREWPKTAVAKGFITREAQPKAREGYVGAVARHGVVAGEPILAAKLVRLNDSGVMSNLLRKGMRAFAIKVLPETSAGGFVLPSDFVDVILTREDTAEIRKRDGTFAEKSVLFTDTLIRNVRVLAIDTAVATKDGAAVAEPKRTATLEVTPEMAEVLSLAERAGRITLALRAFADTTTETGEIPKPEMVVDMARLRSLNIGRLSRGAFEGHGEPERKSEKSSEKAVEPKPDAHKAESKKPESSGRKVIVVRGSVKSDAKVD